MVHFGCAVCELSARGLDRTPVSAWLQSPCLYPPFLSVEFRREKEQTSAAFTPWAPEPNKNSVSGQTLPNLLVSSSFTVARWQEPALTQQLHDTTEVGRRAPPACPVPRSDTGSSPLSDWIWPTA